MRQATVFEEHASVLPWWVQRGVRGATLVVLDAHLDLQPIDAGSLARLRGCADADAMRALQWSDPFLAPGDACFGIEDFLYPAARIGLVDHVVWVAPPHAMRAGFGPALERLVQMDGITLADLDSLQLSDDGWIDGRLAGVAVSACTLQTLGQRALPAGWLLDIDIDFFVDVPTDSLWMDPLQVLRALRALPGAPEELTVSRSAGSGFTPQHLRGVADILAAAWGGSVDDEAARSRLPPDSDLGDMLTATHSRKLPFDAAKLRQARDALVSQAPGMMAERAARAWVALGRLACELGHGDAALEADARACALGHAHPELALALALGLLAADEPARAQTFVQRALSHGSTRARTLALRAWLAGAASDLDTARRCCHAEAQATPANAAAMRRLARLCDRLDDPVAADRARAAADDAARRLAAAVQRLRPFRDRLDGVST